MKHQVNYESIEQYIKAAQLQRSIYLAELLSDAIIFINDRANDFARATWKAVLETADVLMSMARERTRKNVFTIE